MHRFLQQKQAMCRKAVKRWGYGKEYESKKKGGEPDMASVVVFQCGKCAAMP